MIESQGARIAVSATDVTIYYSSLLASLRGAAERSVPLADITSVQLSEPTETAPGAVTLSLAGSEAPLSVTFPPQRAAAAQSLATRIEAARRGEATGTTAGLPGLNFVAFDVETANEAWGSICQMGAVRFRDGTPRESRSWLCQPPTGLDFHEDNIAIHGITAQDVANSPTFATCLAEFLEFLGDDPFVAHYAYFDASALLEGAHHAGVTLPPLTFGCSLAFSRLPRFSFPKHGLAPLSKEVGVSLDQHHDAECDARACGELLVILAQQAQVRGSLAEIFATVGLELGNITDDELFPVLTVGSRRAAAHSAWDNRPMSSGNSRRTSPHGAQRKASGTKSAKPRWAAASTPETIPDPNPDAPADSPLYGAHVTLSGNFEPYDKGELWEKMAALGASIGKNVTKKTTILVAGPWQGKTSKQKRAEELQDKGQDIAVWSAADLYAALGLE